MFTPTLNEGCHNATGGTVGGQIGYRWQSGGFVFGIEGQGNWANFKGSNLNLLAGGGFIPVGLTDQSKVNGFGLLTGQVGYAWNNVLWYVKGGAAVVGDKYTTYVVPGALVNSASESSRGRRDRHRPRSRLCAELVCGRRIRPPVHGHAHSHREHASRRIPRDRSNQAGRGPRHGPRELSLGWPGDLEVLKKSAESTFPGRPASRRPFA